MLKLEKTALSATPNPWSYPIAGLAILSSMLMSLWYWQQGFGSDALTAGRAQVFYGHEYWRLFTTTLIHADLKHFLSNSIFFFIFGYLLNGYFGLKVFPLLSLIMGGVINALTLALYPDHAVLLGASGVVYFMAAFWATLYYQIERGEKHIKRFVAVVGVSLLLFFPQSFDPQVSYLAHAWGFVTGIISGLIYFQWNREKIQAQEEWRETEPMPTLVIDEWADAEISDAEIVKQPTCELCSP